MEEIKIAVCDDDIFALGAITGALQSIFKDKQTRYKASTFRGVAELETAMKGESFDLILLDIDMPDTDGIEFGNKLRGRNDCTAIIYVSNREERVFESFSVRPLGFVRKSSFFKDLGKYVDLFLDGRAAAKKNASLSAEYHGEMYSILLDDIAYIESSKKNQIVYPAEGGKCYTLNTSMQELENRLESEGFARVHHGFIINYKYVALIGNDVVSLKDGRSVPISRRKVKNIKESYFEFMRERGSINI